VIADSDGVVLIPAALVEETAALGQEQERLEAWILEEVKKGAALPGLYPPNAENQARYKAHARIPTHPPE
jgi:regulator of RNase E activity RraA